MNDMHELALIAHETAGVPVPRRTVPMAVARGWARARSVVSAPTDSLFTTESLHALESDPHVDGRRAAAVLGHQARPLRETVADLYRWFGERDAARAVASLA